MPDLETLRLKSKYMNACRTLNPEQSQMPFGVGISSSKVYNVKILWEYSAWRRANLLERELARGMVINTNAAAEITRTKGFNLELI